MKAAVFQGPGAGLTIEERPDPSPGTRQLVVEVAACGICGTDITMTSGHGALRYAPGTTPGHEYGGKVVAVGPGVERVSVGDHVVGYAIPAGACGHCESCRRGLQQWCTGSDKVFGSGAAYAEYTVLAEPLAVVVPPELAGPDAALVEPLAVGLHGVDRAALRPGDDVVVLGAGPIGVAAVYWARRLGARRIVVVATSARREPVASALGASTFVVAGDDPVAEAIEAAGGQPAVVIEAAGVPGMLDQASALVRSRGTVVVLGCCAEPDPFIPAWPLLKEITIRFSAVYTAGDFDHVVRTLSADPVGPRPMVTATVGLAELPARFEQLRGPHGGCKVMIDPHA